MLYVIFFLFNVLYYFTMQNLYLNFAEKHSK